MADLHDLAAAYALNALDASERAAFEAHLDGCTACTEELAAFDPAIAALGDAAAVTPPNRLRNSVLDAIETAPQLTVETTRPSGLRRGRFAAPRWATGLAAAVAAVVVLVVSGVIGGGTSLDDVARADDAQTITLRGDVGTARFVYSESLDTGYFVSALLPAVPADETYQLWLIGDGGPTSAGTFTPSRDLTVEVRVEGGIESGKTLGLTIEPAGGSAAPTGDVLLAEVLASTFGLEL